MAYNFKEGLVAIIYYEDVVIGVFIQFPLRFRSCV